MQAANFEPALSLLRCGGMPEARDTQYWLKLIQAADLVLASIIHSVLQEAIELTAILTIARRKLNTGSEAPCQHDDE